MTVVLDEGDYGLDMLDCVLPWQIVGLERYVLQNSESDAYGQFALVHHVERIVNELDTIVQFDALEIGPRC